MVTRFLLKLFVFFAPFTSFLAISGWLRIPVIFMILLLIIVLIFMLWRLLVNNNYFEFKLGVVDLILVWCLFFIWVSFCLNTITLRSFNHSLAYSFAFLGYFISFKQLSIFKKINYEEYFKVMYWSTLACCFIIILDWFLYNFFMISLREAFIVLNNGTANMTYYKNNNYFFSVGGVAEEPGSMAFFLNIYGMLGLAYLEIHSMKFKYIMFLIIYVISMLFLTSVAGVMSISLSCLFILYVRLPIKAKFSKKRFISLARIFVIALILIIGSFSYINWFIEMIMFKINFSSELNLSGFTRFHTWNKAIETWINNPFYGMGPGYGIESTGSGYHSVFLTILSDTGIFAFALFILFILFILKMIYKINSPIRIYILFAFTASIFHLNIIGDFYHAPFWVLIAIICIINKQQTHTQNDTFNQSEKLKFLN